MKSFYITTTLPYVNAAPHIGFALEIIQADILARYKRLKGYSVIFNTGTDEHGAKIYEKAKEERKDIQIYVDEYAAKFDLLKSALNLSYTNFIRTTDPTHMSAAQEFWRRCVASGDIEKRIYSIRYCVGCELEKTDSELENGKCPLHPDKAIEMIKEENYFFKFSRYRSQLLKLYKESPDFVVPSFRLKEIENFVEKGLSDFSISRLKEKMPWGVPVPDDDTQVMYVWFDALVNYISTLGWPKKESNFDEFWPGVQIAGKDNLRQQSAMWQAMLLSAGIPHSKQIFVHGFITSSGQKMSKSAGNVVDPFSLVKFFGTDGLRYSLIREIPSYEDGDFSLEKFKTRYNADLANGIGNFSARTSTIAQGMTFEKSSLFVEKEIISITEKIKKEINDYLEIFKFNEALASLWELIRFGDGYANEKTPWKIKEKNEKEKIVYQLVFILKIVGELVIPFLPQTGEKINSSFVFEGNSFHIKEIKNLFPRIQ